MKLKTILCASLAIMSPMLMASNGADEGYGQDPYNYSEEQIMGVAASSGAIKYLSFTATSAQNIQAVDTWSYVSGACRNNDSNTSIFLDESLNLPIGSIIVSYGLYYIDNNTGGAKLELYNFDGEGGFSVDAEVSGPAINGANSVGDFLWLATTATSSNVARFTMSATPSADVCLARIGYIPYDIASDVIFANKLEY